MSNTNQSKEEGSYSGGAEEAAMKRYDFDWGYVGIEQRESEYGEWVRYEDTLAHYSKELDHAYAEGRKDEAEALGEQAPCPNCGGSGTVTAYTNEGPDAQEVEVDCDHCGGKQTLLDAYRGVVRLLAKKHAQYLDLFGRLSFGSHPSHQRSFKEGWLDCRATMARFVEPTDKAIAMSIRANWKPALGQDPDAKGSALSSQSEAAETAKEPEGMRAAFMAWVADQGCDTVGAWSAWQGCWDLLSSQSASAPVTDERQAFNEWLAKRESGRGYPADLWEAWQTRAALSSQSEAR